jgi:SAM-dependent methyltransferase
MQPVIDYYDKLAPAYDEKRFGNSYGTYIDGLERRILTQWLAAQAAEQVIDLGCGTGRLLNFAKTGVDGAVKMLEVAAAKYPDRVLHHADLTQVNMKVTGRTFRAGLCFHVLMHLSETEIRAFLQQAALLVEKGGVLIVDIPSATRRRLGRRPTSGWHGNRAASLALFAEWAGPNWRVSRWVGLLLLPIHRFPGWSRPWLQRLDAALCRTPLGRFASYYLLELQRQRMAL